MGEGCYAEDFTQPRETESGDSFCPSPCYNWRIPEFLASTVKLSYLNPCTRSRWRSRAEALGPSSTPPSSFATSLSSESTPGMDPPGPNDLFASVRLALVGGLPARHVRRPVGRFRSSSAARPYAPPASMEMIPGSTLRRTSPAAARVPRGITAPRALATLCRASPAPACPWKARSLRTSASRALRDMPCLTLVRQSATRVTPAPSPRRHKVQPARRARMDRIARVLDRRRRARPARTPRAGPHK